MEDTQFYTATMAQVYAEQGHTEKAIEIYRYILQREPERNDIADALKKIEEKLSNETPATDKRLLRLFHEWITLMLTDTRLKSLKKIKETQKLVI